MKNKYLIIIVALISWVILYMNLQNIADFLVDSILKMTKGEHLTEAIRFFIFEVPKVMLLLILIIFAVGIIRSYFSPEKTRKALEGKSVFTGNVLASLLGVVTPFCTCSAIPLFLGFVEAGIPLGVTFSFLIAAPMINEVAIILLVGMVGWQVALIYVATGLIIAIISGFVIEKLDLRKYLADWVLTSQMANRNSEISEKKLSLNDRIDKGLYAVKEIVGKVWIYILIGIGIGAGAHGYVPDNYLAELLGSGNWFTIPLAVIIGIPLYSNAAGIIPIVSVLIEKGVSVGTALAFMMSVIGLSLPEMIILKKVLKWQLLAAFVGITGTGILIVGFLFNWIL